jgi:hypothetical protein
LADEWKRQLALLQTALVARSRALELLWVPRARST